jgi:hypothetical protein
LKRRLAVLDRGSISGGGEHRTRQPARHHVDVPLLVDTASATRRLAPDAFARWAAARTVFLSSEMRQLADLRGLEYFGWSHLAATREATFQIA